VQAVETSSAAAPNTPSTRLDLPGANGAMVHLSPGFGAARNWNIGGGGEDASDAEQTRTSTS
jgi:hypothetical protein